MKTRFYTIVLFILSTYSLNAQIGYQVSLLNSATGEPRANETVEVTIELTNSEGTVICTETKSETTNEFGILSLQVGSDKTFENMDWSKLPLYVSATVDGIMIGKSQILNVPVAEAAKTLVNVDPDLICKTWTSKFDGDDGKIVLTFHKDMTFSFKFYGKDDKGNWVVGYDGNSTYTVVGNTIYLLVTTEGNNFLYCPSMVFYQEGHLYGQLFIYPLKFN